MKNRITNRGFDVAEFKDRNGVECSIQKSSSAEEDCIWLGADNIGLKYFKAYQGWKDVDLVDTEQEHYVANNRMHLNREQVKNLLPYLHNFVETGEIILDVPEGKEITFQRKIEKNNG